MTGAGLANAKSIELIEITNETSFKSKKDQKEKLALEESALRYTVDSNPTSRRAKLELAKFLFHQNSFQDAKQLAIDVLSLDEDNANALCLLGRIHGFGKPQDIKQSEEYLKLALISDRNYAKAHYFYAYLLRSHLKNYSSAEYHYKCAIKLRPNDVTSYNDCAIMLVRNHRFIEAKDLYEKVLNLQPQHSIAHFNLANLLRKDMKKFKEAEHHFLIAIKERPKFIAAINNYATMLHHQLQRYLDAEHYYQQALRVNPKYSRAHFNYANLCREHLKKFNVAEEHYLEAIVNDERNPNFYNNYGLLLQYAMKKYPHAKKQYEIALKLDDKHALGHCNYATILMQMVDKKYNPYYNEITDTFEDECKDGESYNGYMDDIWVADEIKISFMEEQLNKERIDIYSMEFEGKKIEYFTKSEFHFKKSIYLNNTLVMAYNNYGCLLRRLKKYKEAKEMFQKALTIDPKFIMAQRNLNRAVLRERDISQGRDPDLRERRNKRKVYKNDTNKTGEGKDEKSCIIM